MKNVVVTGGTRGLGLGITQVLIESGYHVTVIARRVSDDISQLLEEKPDQLKFVRWDLLTEMEAFSGLADTLRETGPIYGLVNNAGNGLAGILSTTPVAKIEETVDLNILSPLLLTKSLVPSMMLKRDGRIINISSIVANTGYPGLSVYSATKAALVGFTHSLAREVGQLGITVNAVAPGFLDTEMTHDLSAKQRQQIIRRSAMQRMATVRDVAAMVNFLLSEEAKNITGQVITVDAGNTT